MPTNTEYNLEGDATQLIPSPVQRELAGSREYIRNSWLRCAEDYGLVRGGRPGAKIVEDATLDRDREELGELLEIAENECRNLYSQTAHSGSVIVLTNAEGVILSSFGDPATEDVFKLHHLIPGAVWSEQYQGTNGMGTCLQTDRMILVHQNDHYFESYHELTCISAPIHDPHGNLVGVLDASAVNSRDVIENRYTSALLEMSANHIEHQHFQRAFNDAVLLSFHPRSEYLSVGAAALLAIDGDGCILAANSRALRHLEIAVRRELLGRHVREVLSIPPEALNHSISGVAETVWPVHDVKNGRRFFANLRMRTNPIQCRCDSSQSNMETITVQPKVADPCFTLKTLAGRDPRMAYNARCAHRVADKNLYILLRGETGTGKEEFARAVHLASNRSDKPFIALNCAAIPEALIESELFGYKGGAFTGARREGMRGCVAEADGGTLFLDEIGDMPLHLQTRLLRVLETKEVLPLGGHRPVKVDLHVVSATHQDLRLLAERKEFREDLYFRLNGLTLTLPPLRERQDLDQLVRCALAIENETDEPVAIKRNAFSRLMAYNWPGNIRELRNVIRTAHALSDDNLITLVDLPAEIAGLKVGAAPTDNFIENIAENTAETQVPLIDETEFSPLERAERQAILQEIKSSRWNMTIAAKKLRMSRSTLYRKLKKYKIELAPSV